LAALPCDWLAVWQVEQMLCLRCSDRQAWSNQPPGPRAPPKRRRQASD
jgi:hypothetical protein